MICHYHPTTVSGKQHSNCCKCITLRKSTMTMTMTITIILSLLTVFQLITNHNTVSSFSLKSTGQQQQQQQQSFSNVNVIYSVSSTQCIKRSSLHMSCMLTTTTAKQVTTGSKRLSFRKSNTLFRLYDTVTDLSSSSSSSSADKTSTEVPVDVNESNVIDIPLVNSLEQQQQQDESVQVNESQNLILAQQQQPSPQIEQESIVSIWPCGDTLDKKLVKLSIPVMINNAINPLIGAVDLFWISRMGLPLAIAGQAAANQVFASMFWLTSFLPNVSATIIGKEYANNNQEAVTDAICQAMFIGIIMAIIPTIWILLYPNQILSTILPNPNSPALQYAIPYLFIRAFAFVPSLISIVGFSSFRGTMDTVTPVKISLFANVFNMILDPILIFTCKMGVTGAAIATLAAEIISCVTYLYLLRKKQLLPKNLFKIFKIPSYKQLQPLIKGGSALQLRNIALNLTFLMVARVTQGLDTTHGIVASAHALAIQIFQLGGIVLLALSIVAQTIIPNDIIKNGYQSARTTSNRLLSWGLIAGGLLGILQIVIGIPLVQRTTPLQSVRDAAVVPALLGSIYQLINGLVFIGEGIMIGTGSFLQLSCNTVIATIGCLWALQTLPSKYGLTGVWLGFGVFNIIRLAGVGYHHFISGPLAPYRKSNTNKISTISSQ